MKTPKSSSLWIGLLLILSLALSACAAPASAPAAPGTSAADSDQPITIRMWFGREDFVPGDKFETFHAENPNIRVEYDVIPLEQAHSDYLRNFAARNAPDIFQIFHQFGPTLVAQNSLLDITQYKDAWEASNPEDYADIIPVAWNIATVGDGIYGIGIHVAPYFLGYRLDWLEQAGLSEAKTWDDVLEISRVLRDTVLDKSADQYAFAHPGGAHHPPFWWMSIFMSMGGQYSDTGLPQIDSDAGVALISFMQTLTREELHDPEANTWASGDMRGAFMSGRAAFFPEAINIFASTQKQLEYGTQWQVQLQPYREGAEDDYRVNSYGWPYVVSAATPHPEAVMKVLEYLFRPEIVSEVALRYQPATRVSVMTSDEYLAAHPYFPILEEGFINMSLVPGHVRNPEVSAILNELKQAAFTNPDRDPKEIAAEFQARLNALDE